MTDPAALYTRYRGEVFALCYHLTGSREDAEDLVQDVFVRALTHPIPPDYTAQWLKAIALNLVRDRGRHAALVHFVPWEPAYGTDADEVTPERLVLHTESVRHLRRVLTRLPAAHRRALLARAEGHPLTTIGADLHLPPKTVKALLARARRNAQRALAS